MVSHSHRFAFLKTRKTAGTSVELFLQPFCVPDDVPVVEKTHTIESERGIVGTRLIAPGDGQTEADRKWFNHMPASDVRANLGRLKWWRYLKVATIRNPFDRLVSQFHYRHRNQPALPDDPQAHRSAFREFVMSGRFSDDADIVFVNGRFVVDVLLRYETLTEDLARLCARLGLDPARTALPQTKMTRDRRQGIPVAGYYDDEIIGVVRKALDWNFRYGGYPDRPEGA